MADEIIPKILIACPLGDGKEYSINEWFKWISEQEYENYDVAVCVNGNSEESIKKKVDLLEKVEINKKKLIIRRIDFNEYYTTKIKISLSREKLRDLAIYEGYDYIFWLDSDTIPVTLNAIPLLLNSKQDCVSGLYFYKNSSQPIVIDETTGTNMDLGKIKTLAENNHMMKVWGFGFGCVLISKNVFSRIPFDYTFMKENWTDDFQYCEFMDREHIERWFNPLVVCKHFSANDFTIIG
jgi:hypothetical protein